ncbi:FAD-dependent oxidoreductase [Alcaligenes faecalis]|uniref:FAD-dependent oxidoreductase n=1 Tax=Alcaligenes faecalis TaxID=511 RepID=UPI000B4C57F8|nr:NAD(P)/FAD-dependent oxidoreductase [Alcaligenes faecalis]ASC91717.1 monooxygenase [Alcaligenes faecalis]
MSDKKLSALIAGGGLGGLATAAALAQRGWDVTVLERQSELRANGSGIYIWENGLRVLKALGAYEQAIEGAFYGSHFEQRDLNNEVIDCGPTPPDRRLITVMRSQLLKSLEQAGKRAGVKVRTNVEVIAASARGEVQLASGERLRADLVVGADGIWSRIRQSLGLELVHEQTREGALRTMITRKPDDTDEQDAQKYIENWNGLHRLLITPVSETQTYLALTCPYDDVRASNVQIDKEYWSALFPHWAHLIERADGPVSWGRYSVTRCKTWSSGRTAILGDAAHAQPPNLGQGGGMAMQNGLALATFLEKVQDARDIPEALEAWENNEREIVEHCQKWSCLYGEISALPDAVRTQVVRSAMANPWSYAQIFRAASHTPTGTVQAELC